MSFTFEASSTVVDLARFEPGHYVRFNTRSHGTVIMVAIWEKLHGGSDDQAIYRFLITCDRVRFIDGVPAVIKTGGKFSVGDGRVTFEITDPIKIDC